MTRAQNGVMEIDRYEEEKVILQLGRVGQYI